MRSRTSNVRKLLLPMQYMPAASKRVAKRVAKRK